MSNTMELNETEKAQLQIAKTKELEAAPVDPRFATTVDQYKYCWSSYNEMLRCWSKNGYKNEKCNRLAFVANDICPSDQIKMFYEQRRDDKWHGFGYPMQQGELAEGDEITKRERHSHGHH